MRIKNIIIAALVVLAFVSTIFGQQHTENKSDQSLRSAGRVNPSTLAMEIDIPLGSYPGRGINVPVGLSYSSKLWRIEYGNYKQPAVNNPDTCISSNFPKYGENSASGWTTSMAVPYIEYVGQDNLFNAQGSPAPTYAPPCDAPIFDNNAYIRRVVLHLPSGESHELRMDDTVKVYPSYSNCVDNDPNTPCDSNDPTLPGNWTGWFYAADGSNIRYFEDRINNVYYLQLPDGSKYDFVSAISGLGSATIRKANKYTDRNGNFTTYHEPDTNYPNGYWTDTLGKIIEVPFGLSAPASPTTQTYSMPGMTGDYKFYWKQLDGGTEATSAMTYVNNAPLYQLKYMSDRASMNPNDGPRANYLFFSGFEEWVIDSGAPLFNPVVLAEIELPTGQKYKFRYDNYGRMERIYYPTGGEERFEYSNLQTLAWTEGINTQTNFGVTKREVFPTAGQGTPYQWLYSAGQLPSNSYLITITNPDNTKTERYLHRNSEGGVFGYDTALAGMAYEERVYDSSSPQKLVSKKLTTWTATSLSITGGYTTQTAHWHPRVTQEETQIFDTTSNGVSATMKYEYDGEENLTRETPLLTKKISQYAFVVAGNQPPSTPVRTSETTFLINDANYPQWVKDIYKNQNMIRLATSMVVKDGAGTVVARSETLYDEGVYSPNIGRGNPTTTRVWDSTKGDWDNPNAYIATRAKFDAWGNQIESTDAKGNITFREYDATYHAYPIKVTTPIPDPTGQKGSNTAFETTTTYNTTTGLPLTTTDVNGQTTTMEYDPVTLRPTRVIPPAGDGIREMIYHDEPNNYWVKNRKQIEANNWAESITYFDGLGRTYKTEEVDSNGNIFVNKEFDSDGRVLRVSNSYRLNNDPCYQNNQIVCWTTNIYDEASRIKEIILQDGAKAKTDYSVSVTGVIGVTK